MRQLPIGRSDAWDVGRSGSAVEVKPFQPPDASTATRAASAHRDDGTRREQLATRTELPLEQPVSSPKSSCVLSIAKMGRQSSDVGADLSPSVDPAEFFGHQ